MSLPSLPNAALEHELDWNDRLQDWLDGDLDASQRAAVEAHLADCTTCGSRVAELRAIDQALRGAAPQLALDHSFDERLFAQIEGIDEAKRAEARRRIEQELQWDLSALTRSWRRALLFMIPGIVAGIALAFGIAAWLQDSSLTHMLVTQSAAELGRDTHNAVQIVLTALLGTGLGLLLARWFASVVE